MKFSVIIPVYNEEKTVGEIIKRVKAVHYPANREIIVVNDGSTDKSAKIIASIPGIIFINNKTNKGKGFTLRTGFKRAKGDIILIQDADLEYNPNDHLKLIELLKHDFVDVVYGSRFIAGHHTPRYTFFYFGNILLSFLTKVLYMRNISDMETCYKAFKKRALIKIRLKEDRFGFEPEITCKLIKKDFNILEVPISYESRSYAEGKKIGFLDGLRAIYILFKYRFFD